MSAIILNFPGKSLALCAHYVSPAVDYCSVNHGVKLFVLDSHLGRALGYVEPLVAIEDLFRRHEASLSMYSMEVNLDATDFMGRKRIRVFDLHGAILLCKLANTPNARVLHAKLCLDAIHDFDENPKPNSAAKVIPFPVAPKPKKGRARTRRMQHG